MNAPTRRKDSPKKPSGKPQEKTLTGETLRTREDILARWCSLQQAKPGTLLRHAANAMHEKAGGCAEQAHIAFDCIDDRETAEEQMLAWLTLAGELRALESLIREQIDTDEEL